MLLGLKEADDVHLQLIVTGAHLVASHGNTHEAIRHSITKNSHVHFTSAEPFRQKVIQMCERPNTVYNFGALGLDNIASLQPFPQK